MSKKRASVQSYDNAITPSDFYAMEFRKYNKQHLSSALHTVAEDAAHRTNPPVTEDYFVEDEEYNVSPADTHQDFRQGREFTTQLGVRVIDGLPVPESLRYDIAFLTLPREYQVYLLKEIANGKLMVRQPSAMAQTERHSVRLFVGQWEQLKNTISKAAPYQDDRRRSLTANHLLREYISLCQGVIAPHLNLKDISTEEGLRQELMRAFTRAAREVLDLPEED